MTVSLHCLLRNLVLVVNFLIFPSLFVLQSSQFSPLSIAISNNVATSYFLASIVHLFCCPLLRIWFSFFLLALVNLISLSSTSWSVPLPPVLPCPLLNFTRFSTSLRFAIVIVFLYVASHLLLCCRLCYQNLAGPKEGKAMGERGKLSDNNGTMSHSHNN